MASSNTVFFSADNGGARSGIDRRQFSYNFHIPERRSTRDRRAGKDRRTGKDRRNTMEASVPLERRNDHDRRSAFRNQEGAEVPPEF